MSTLLQGSQSLSIGGPAPIFQQDYGSYVLITYFRDGMGKTRDPGTLTFLILGFFRTM